METNSISSIEKMAAVKRVASAASARVEVTDTLSLSPEALEAMKIDSWVQQIKSMPETSMIEQVKEHELPSDIVSIVADKILEENFKVD